MMKPRDIAIAILSKRKKPEDEDADRETAASNVLAAIKDEDPEALSESLMEFVRMCED